MADDHPPQIKTLDPSRRHWLGLSLGVAMILAAMQVLPLIVAAPEFFENRAPAAWPTAPKDSLALAKFFERVDTYLSDHFPARSHLIAGLNFLRYQFGYSHSQRIIVGQDGWLFFDNGHHLDFDRDRRLSPGELDQRALGFVQRRDQALQAGARFYVLPAPYKPSIYPEKLPSALLPIPGLTEIDQMQQAFLAQGLDNLVDPRPALRAIKDHQAVYTAYDTHWRFIGAYQAYEALMKRMAKDDPSLAPLPLEAFTSRLVAPSEARRDLAAFFGIASFITPDRVGMTPPGAGSIVISPLTERSDRTAPMRIETGVKNGRVLLFVHDSFGEVLVNFLEAHFQTIIWLHVEAQHWPAPDQIQAFHPDVILLEVQEEGLRYVFDPL